jgi:dolichol-phosphate mannosyltransferase
MQKSARVSVILPVLSETGRLVELVARLRELLGADLFEIQIIVSPKSPAEALAACEEARGLFGNTHVSVQRRSPGVGFAYRDGIEEARGDLLLLMDTGAEFDVETLPLMLAKQHQPGADLVVGSRWMHGGIEGCPRRK